MKEWIDLICGHCECHYKKPPSLAKRSRFCSKACYDKSQSTSEVRLLKCRACGCQFSSKKDHDKWPKFCSRECYLSKCLSPVTKKCRQCGGVFASRNSGGGVYQNFCTKECYTLSQKCREDAPCANCGVNVSVTKSRIMRASNIFCTKKCKADFYSGKASNFYKEGDKYTGKITGHVYLFVEGRWVAEHRVVAAEIMLRDLRYWSEPIIHLNGVPDDNRPENLYVFPSMQEMTRCLRHWVRPSESNIKPKVYKGL